MRHIVRTHVVFLEHRVSSMPNAQRKLIDDEVGTMVRQTAPLALARLFGRCDRDQVPSSLGVIGADAPAVTDSRRVHKVLVPCVLDAKHAMDHGDTIGTTGSRFPAAGISRVGSLHLQVVAG
ncbi:hypothetical protein [uncultured Jatrophihabitans sp.]|uniref:hypothetical protein n=1 Tax=uncultured Jatrophihabitans sp. TaxID=1610747 RepID=UPI0035C99B34